jgi:hypothetical protein
LALLKAGFDFDWSRFIDIDEKGESKKKGNLSCRQKKNESNLIKIVSEVSVTK